jgi:hypothetical protein
MFTVLSLATVAERITTSSFVTSSHDVKRSRYHPNIFEQPTYCVVQVQYLSPLVIHNWRG